MFCTNCGFARAGEARFCTSCGQAFEAVKPAKSTRAAKESKASDPASAPLTNNATEPVPDGSADPYKPAGMSHAEYAYGDLPANVGKSTGGGARVAIIAAVVVGAIAIAFGGISLAKNSQTQNASSNSQDYSSTDGSSDSTTTDTYSDPSTSSGSTDSSGNGSSVPANSWAPDDFTEYDDYVAYKWTSDSVDGTCDSCTYATMQVMSHYGCSTISVDMTFFDAEDNEVDYGSEYASNVKAGRRASLEFDTYVDNADTVDVDSITCD